MARFAQVNIASVFICDVISEKVRFLRNMRLRERYMKRKGISQLKGGDSERKQESHRESDSKKKKKFSGNTMADGVLQLNKLSRGLFLS